MTAFIDETSRDSASPFIVWGNALLGDPPAALSDILSGRGARGAQQRAEPEDFLADLLAHPTWRDCRAQLTEGLDAALLDLFKAWFEWSPARISRFGVRAYATRISDALRVAARLPLKGTARDLISNQATWDNRFRGLRWPGDIDLLRQFNLLLAQHQTDTRFVSRWFAACDEAAWGSPYWQSSLSTGLIGLRKLPATADTEPERRVAAALARFAALALERGMSAHLAETAFRRRVAALKVLYPRHDGHWQDVWDRALEELVERTAGRTHVTPANWLDHVLVRRDANGVRSRRGTRQSNGAVAGRAYALPDAERRKQIARALDRAGFLNQDLWERTRQLIQAHWAYASGSGESYFAVRTTHNLCNRLLRCGPTQQHLAEIHVWTLQAIEAESENAYVWDLWAKVLSALGRDDVSLSIRWESIRRFPDDCVLRNSLAEGLLDHRREALVENLLRETIRDFPSDVVSRHVLVNLLWRQGREDEARNQFVRLKVLAPDNPYVESLGGTMSMTHAGNSREISPGLLTQTDPEVGVATIRQSMPVPVGDWETGRERPEDWLETAAYFGRLTDQVPLLESYFAPFQGAEHMSTSVAARAPGAIVSELELVAAHRDGRLEGPGGREQIEVWATAWPSSYAARLLLAWQGRENNGLDGGAMSRIASEFPQNRGWTEWLRYQFISVDERSRLRREVQEEDEMEKAFWSGRLTAVYPSLKKEDDDESAVHPDQVALKRLVEDVALAGAVMALPNILIS